MSAAIPDLEGVLWPWMPGGDDSLPWVERDDEVDRFRDDVEAAEHVAKLTGMPVMFATLDGEKLGSAPYDGLTNLRPFVFALPSSSVEDAINGGDAWEVWNHQRSKRFGHQREEYDKQLGITRFPVGARVIVRETGAAGEVSGREDHSRWVVLDGECEGRIFNCNQLKKED